VYVPLDPSYPRARRHYMLEDAKVCLVVADAAYRDQMRSEARVDVVDIIAHTGALDTEDNGDPGPPTRLERDDLLAYVMYTSGSSGQPKGVAIDQKAVTRLAKASAYLPLSAGLTFSQSTNVSFDPSTLEIWGPLLNGGTVALLDDPHVLQPQRFGAFLRRRHATSTIMAIALVAELTRGDPTTFSSLDHLLFGGDRAEVETLRRIRAGGFTGVLINGYGPTEATTLATTYEVTPADLQQDTQPSLPIGRPLAHTEVLVLTPDLTLCGIGQVGELCIGGCGIARGYWGRPGLTAEHFVPHPFSDVPGARLYRTGDYVYWNEEGNLAFVGRTDDQVKVDGFRIELDEVRAQLLAHPQVQDVAVHAAARDDGRKQLHAYLMPAGASPPGLEDIRAFATRRLPDYMVPSRMTWVADFPLTSNAKIDFAALEAMRQASPSTDRRTAAPDAETAPARSELTLRFLSLCARILERSDIDETDRFFDVGGTSLIAMRLSVATASELGRPLSLPEIVQSETIGGLVGLLESRVGAGTHVPIPTSPRTPAFTAPLSFGQEGLHFLDQMQAGRAYSVPYCLDIEGHLDTDALARAFTALVQRHEALRTRFVPIDNAYRQVIDADAVFTLPCEDVPDGDDREATIAARLDAFIRTPYDLEAGPLLRGLVLRLGPDRSRLLFGLHHAIFDGWSVAVMARELDALYRGAVEGRPVDRPALPVQYADFATWQRDRYAEGDFDADLAYWRQTLDGAPAVLTLATDYSRPAMLKRTGRRQHFELNAPLSQGVRAVARKLGVTPFVVCTAAVNVMLSRYSGQTDLCIGFPIAGRTHPALDDLIGYFANILVLRTQLAPDGSFREAVEATNRALLGAMDHAEMPFYKLVDAMVPARSMSTHPLFQVCVTHQTAGSPWRLGDLSVVAQPCPTETSKFDLTIDIEEQDNLLRLAVEYADELFSDNSIQKMMNHLIRALGAYALNPDERARIDVDAAGIAASPRRLRHRPPRGKA
ncbi:MAG: amino acid adenylation domain-containing protein, partial [Myxococcota bacterium]